MQADLVSKDIFSVQLIRTTEKTTIALTTDIGQRHIDFIDIFNDEQSQHSERLEKINLINKEVVGMRASTDNNSSITFQYHLWLEEGIAIKNIVFPLRGFQMMVDAALDRFNS
ncbi:MAG: YbjN domain-containing protein [Leptolyngbyaceae cyanobacterium MAG.088]|nr:YbjN domain-containing protein [Leptolyngbyaceae cyanobacterium MAG.088]